MNNFKLGQRVSIHFPHWMEKENVKGIIKKINLKTIIVESIMGCQKYNTETLREVTTNRYDRTGATTLIILEESNTEEKLTTEEILRSRSKQDAFLDGYKAGILELDFEKFQEAFTDNTKRLVTPWNEGYRQGRKELETFQTNSLARMNSLFHKLKIGEIL